MPGEILAIPAEDGEVLQKQKEHFALIITISRSFEILKLSKTISK
jgi:hypothetical protein